ncbi:ABC transporter ATP-binding protein [Lachnospiraceae bacterium MD1]|uniref:ABC transporter ATP-binding protein n=2 Tax=Variimorphobacter saccharofermentans TaxID=2755051 RepID=A0A839JW27_9FIRM|nr:ABC transporter ATP-binding protein [Variimorphobacter saccharofermentans]MBB2181464.1 ABC transporter ATP-binding protein [Variimorphobacter saccharofermentans]
MMKQILEATNLCKSYSNGSVMQHVLRNLNIQIYEGDFTVIMGSSGSGKSTLLYALSGMDKPTLGNIQYRNEDISNYNNDKLAVFRRKHCGFIFQQMYLNDTMSVMDNILVSGLLVTKDRKELKKKAEELLQAVGLNEECYHKFPSQLSGGEAQRVAIVRALINSPEIVFADEPTGALNSQNATNVLDVMTDMNAKGQSIVMVTHDMKTARRANRILYLKDGIIIDELNLGMYIKGDQERHDTLRTFLEKMGW